MYKVAGTTTKKKSEIRWDGTTLFHISSETRREYFSGKLFRHAICFVVIWIRFRFTSLRFGVAMMMAERFVLMHSPFLWICIFLWQSTFSCCWKIRRWNSRLRGIFVKFARACDFKLMRLLLLLLHRRFVFYYFSFFSVLIHCIFSFNDVLNFFMKMYVSLPCL